MLMLGSEPQVPETRDPEPRRPDDELQELVFLGNVKQWD